MNPYRPGIEAVLLGSLLLALTACTRVDPDRFSGYAEADLVYVAPAIGGRVQALGVERGGRVKPGQVLFELERDPESLERAAAGARAEAAAAQVRNLKKGKRVDELRAIEQQLAQARAALALSTSELKRSESLVAQGFLSPNRLDELAATRDRDAARVAELQANLAVARDAARPDEIAAAEAEQRAAENELASSRWREDQTRGIAARPGTVQDVMYRPGEWVAQGSPVVALLPDGAVKVRFFVPQAALAKVRMGDAVAVSCDGCPAGMTARVAFVSDQAEYTPPVIYSNESRAKLVFMVEAKPDERTAQQLKPGQPVDVRLSSGS
ncbi:MAG TPA: HlyD family efflux transporter periplasmic adaptor subunit [Burkholderiaceae bacterium]|nr:HlyD family efflux transporter periplasmic adaptor subunit [Burkholderiaceae bacterium]